MRFEAVHRFHGSPDALADLIADPDFYTALDLPDVSRPVLLDSSTDGQQSRVRLRYEFVGSLDPIARRVVGEDRLAWIQEVLVDHSTNSGQISFNGVADPRRLRGSAHFSLDADGDGCVRRLQGELRVDVPLIGSRAERKIVPGLLRRLDLEATALESALTQRHS
jgi:hypothetical protein